MALFVEFAAVPILEYLRRLTQVIHALVLVPVGPGLSHNIVGDLSRLLQHVL